MVDPQGRGGRYPDAVSADVHRRRWAILGVLCLSLALTGVDVTILTVAIPELISQLGANAGDVQWTIDAYSITLAGLVVAMGAISDRYGRRRLLLIGLVLFGATSGVAAFSQSPAQLIIARGSMGLAAAMILPGTLSILAVVFEPEERGRAIGIWSGVAGLGFILGPPLGGMLLSHFWWGSVLFINVPVVVVAVVATRTIVPESRDPVGHPIDVGGAVLSIVGLTALVYGFVEVPEVGWTDIEIIVSFLLAAVALTGFVFWELRMPEPMLDVRLFRLATFTIPALVISISMFVLFGLEYLLPQYLQFVQGLKPAAVGLLLVPVSITWSVAALVADAIVRRVGERLVMTGALFLLAGGLLASLFISTGPSSWIVVVGSSLAGMGMGLATTPATNLIVGSLPASKAGVGSAMNDVTREAGGAIGIAVIGSLLTIWYSEQLSASLSGLPAEEYAEAANNVGEALEVAGELGGSAGDHLAAAAKSAFVSGYRFTIVVSILIVVALALITWARLASGRFVQADLSVADVSGR